MGKPEEGHDEELVALLEDADSSPSQHGDNEGFDTISEVRHRSGSHRRVCERSISTDSIVRGSEGGDESVDAASLDKFWHRAGWLVLLLVFQSMSSVILKHFELLIQSHPVVIYFLTMLVGAGGNAGCQSTVLVVRRLALAAARRGKDRDSADQRHSMRWMVGSEISVGTRLAVVLFCASFFRCIMFGVKGSECLAVCLSMLVIVFTSTILGAALPLLLNKLHVDPAHAGATIQVVMDISGVTLTCIVSCLVLGLPLSGEQQQTPKDVTTTPPFAQLGFQNIQHEDTQRNLNGFGIGINVP